MSIYEERFGAQGLGVDPQTAERMQEQARAQQQALYQSPASAQELTKRYAQYMQYMQYPPSPPQHSLVTVGPSELLQIRAATAMRKLGEQLPVSVIRKISRVALEHGAAAYAVAFDDGRLLVFDDVNAFPTDADIARIVLEAP